MKKHDARKLDHATLEALRERAVQRVQEGESPEVVARALVQTFGINATKRSGTLRGSCGEDSIPDFWRPVVFDAKLSEFELTSPDPMHEFNAGDGDRCALKALQSEHWTQTKFDRPVILLD